MRTTELVERAEKEGYTLFQPTAEHAEKLGLIGNRILAGLEDINCWDGFTVLLRLCALVAVYGAHIKVDSLEVIPRDTFLKNCAERYDYYARLRDEQRAATKAN